MADSKSFLYFFIVSVLILYYLSNKFKETVSPEVPVIKSPAGSINGALMFTKYGRKISAYRKIPFAKPPVGSLRFKKPDLMLENAWEGIRDGSQKINACTQPARGSLFEKISGKEDCLHLNVYVPQTDKKNLPVMAWIHGGGFNVGDSGDFMCGPGYLLDKDVILVTINYRLNVFGFLTGGNEEIPGNLGMWDQLGGLKWIQKNIAAFGGDPGQVTIFGESAGGWSISYQLASHQSKNLYKGAIVQSGGIDMGLINVDKDISMPKLHMDYIRKVGCDAKDPKAQLECLQQKSVEDLLDNANLYDECNIFGAGTIFPLVWSPYDDHKFIKDPFFELHPKEAFEKGKFNAVPTMIGMTKDEGYLQGQAFFKNESLFKHFWSDDKCPAANLLGHYSFGKPIPNNIKEKIETIKKEYFNGDVETFDREVLQNIANAYTDSGFFYAAEVMAKQLAKKTTTYYYHFDHLGSFSFADFAIDSIKVLLKKMVGYHDTHGLGVCHADELFYIFKSPMVDFIPKSNERDHAMVDKMVELWTNFAIHQNPTPKDKSWPRYGTNGVTYVRLEDSKIIAQNDKSRDKRVAFWEKLFSK